MSPLWTTAAAIIRRQTGDCSRKERQEGRGGGAAAAACCICSRTSTSCCCCSSRSSCRRGGTNSRPGGGGGRGGVCRGEGLGATSGQGASGVSAQMEGVPEVSSRPLRLGSFRFNYSTWDLQDRVFCQRNHSVQVEVCCGGVSFTVYSAP